MPQDEFGDREIGIYYTSKGRKLLQVSMVLKDVPGTLSRTLSILAKHGIDLKLGWFDTSHQGTSSYKTFTPADLADWGEITFSFHFNPDNDPPLVGAAETVTVAWPQGGASWAFTGFVTGVDHSADHLGKMMQDITVKVSGAITMTDAS